MKNHLNIAFFHGLESAAVSRKSEWLHQSFDRVYAPAMDYARTELFAEVLEQVIGRNIQLLAGSSMGGWFAYCLSTHTGIPTILFNPAMHSRRIEPKVTLGDKTAAHRVILGRNDEVISPQMTMDWIGKNEPEYFSVSWEDNAHRTPIDVFAKHILGMV